MASRYGKRPSDFVDELDETEALAVDLEAFRAGTEEAERQRRHAESVARMRGR